MTYEDAEEAEFMKSIYLGRTGEMENTTFAILTPDGRTKLTRVGRGPFFEFSNSADMANGMKRIVAGSYKSASKQAWSDTALPMVKSLELALNVASADSLPLIVIVGKDAIDRQKYSEKLRPLAWSEPLAGQFIYTTAKTAKELKPLTELPAAAEEVSGILVVEPGQFGLSGKVLAHFGSKASADEMTTKLQQVIQELPRLRKDHGTHVRLGIELGVDWESEIPVTDQQSVRARERARGKK